MSNHNESGAHHSVVEQMFNTTRPIEIYPLPSCSDLEAQGTAEKLQRRANHADDDDSSAGSNHHHGIHDDGANHSLNSRQSVKVLFVELMQDYFHSISSPSSSNDTNDAK